MPSFSKPTSEQVQSALPAISSPEHEEYFFARLQNPHWIAPLAADKIFSHPPKAERLSNGRVRYPRWPQSRYLARMAGSAPEEVAGVFATLDTDNLVVISDMIDAARAMPAQIASTLEPKIAKAIRDVDARFLAFDGATDLCLRLAQDDQSKAAMDLAEALFTPRFKDDESPRNRDEYWYKDGIAKIVPVLAPIGGADFLTQLCAWATTSIRARKQISQQSDLDFSYSWRPAIEEHPQNRDYEFAGVMIGATRVGFEAAIRSGSVSLDAALGLLSKQQLRVFRRLSIHLIGEFGDRAPQLARELMLDRELFANFEVKHEYARLVGRQWNALLPDEQASWLSWVDEGPEAITPGYYDKPDDTARCGAQKAYWQFQRLHWIRSHLAGDKQVFYNRMLAEHGEPQLADLNSWHGVASYSITSSAFSAEQLAGMPFAEMLTLVANWKADPERRRSGPTIEGLASEFSKVLARDPARAAVQAREMIGMPAPFVRRFIEVTGETVKKGTPIELAPVLDLAAWIVDQPIEKRTSAEEDSPLVDPDWQWSRNAVASLIEHVAGAKNEHGDRRVSIGFRTAIWRIIRQLLEGPAESYLYDGEEQDHPRVKDWASRMLNSSRGQVMQAVFAYADWIAALLAPGPRDASGLVGGWDRMPEVQLALEKQLDRGDEDFAGRAAFGAYFWLLHWIDAAWVRAHASEIFDLSAVGADASTALGWAAWSTFLIWTRPHVEYYRSLQSQYSLATDHASEVDITQGGTEGAFANLAEHVVVLYARGDFGATIVQAIEADGGIVRRLVTASHESIRTHALQFVGRSLSGDAEALPQEVVQRFMGLWEYYWREAGERDARNDPASDAFGYWFSCGKFPVQWSLERLWEFVQASPRAEPDSLIVERLAAVCETNPVLSARIIQKLVEGDIEGWRVSGWREEAKQILRFAMTSGDESRVIARATLEVLGRRGYSEFGEIAALTSGQ